MIVSIYQINPYLDKEQCKFRTLEKNFPNHNVDAVLYDRAYYGEVPGDSLETVFAFFNTGVRPEGYQGHSLSVSDVIIVHESKSVKQGAYYVDPIGFPPVVFGAQQRLDALFYEYPWGSGMTADILTEILYYLHTGPFLPMEIENKLCGESSALGFLQMTENDEMEAEIREAVTEILGDMELENEGGIYTTKSGAVFKLIRR